MANYCATCGVNYTAREHHCVEKKICRECDQEKPISAFPTHASSWDGHKHTCGVCYEAKKKQDLIHQIGYRGQAHQVQKKTQAQIAQLQAYRSGHKSTLWAKEMLSLPNVVTLDTETTGFSEQDEIIEIGIWDIRKQYAYATLVQCQCTSIPKEAEEKHHITKLMLQDAPTWPQIWPQLMNYLSRRVIIIYNASYDLRMLQQTAHHYNLPMPELQVHCLMKQYSAYIGQSSSHSERYRFLSLANACAHFQVEQPHTHRALADAQATSQVLQKLAAQAEVTSKEVCQKASLAIFKDIASLEPISSTEDESATNRQEEHISHSQRGKEDVKQQKLEEQRAKREKQNMLLRLYGYHWKRTDSLTDEQWSAIHSMMLSEDQTEEPSWVLLSPLEMPVNIPTILHWLGERGTTSEDVHRFLCEHGFITEKDERNIWSIQSPAGENVDLKNALKVIEQKRLDEIAKRRLDTLQRTQERFEQSMLSLKETLNLCGEATNQAHAWGYSPFPFAKRLMDGMIEVTTYHFEGEWQTTLCQTEKDVIQYLYTNSDGSWDVGIWENPV